MCMHKREQKESKYQIEKSRKETTTAKLMKSNKRSVCANLAP